VNQYNVFHNYTDAELIRKSIGSGDDLVLELAARLLSITETKTDRTFRVAVYGSLRDGFGNEGFLDDANYLGDSLVSGFQMYSLGAFPACVPKEGDQVYTEVYEIDMATLEGLDMLEGYPNFYDRQIVDTLFGEALMYYMPVKPKGSTKVPTGDWADFYRPFHLNEPSVKVGGTA